MPLAQHPSEARVYLHRNMLDSLSRLQTSEQQRVRKAIDGIVSAQTLKSLRRHKVGAFWSYSATMDIRVLAVWQGDGLTLVHVDHHDAAYEWAARTRPVMLDGRAVQLIPDLPDAVAIERPPPQSLQPPSVSDAAYVSYVAHGVGEPVARILSGIADESQILDIAETLSPVQQAGVLAALTESTSTNEWGQRDVVLLADDDELRYALTLPSETWRVFLHPRQRFAVEMPSDGNVLLRGGPGTGKTVTLLHRFVRLHESSGGSKPALIGFSQATREVLVEGLRTLGFAHLEAQVLVANGLPNKPGQLAPALREYSALLIDEGQDLPVGMVAVILELLEAPRSRVPPLFIAYDPNQALSRPSGSALMRLATECDSVSLTYSYRLTRENVIAATTTLDALHSRFVGKDFKANHEIESVRDKLTRTLISAASGRPVRVTRVDVPEVESATERAIGHLSECWAEKDLAAIVIDLPHEGSELADRVERSLRRTHPGVVVLSAIQAKGREYMAGVVVDAIPYPVVPIDAAVKVSPAFYRGLAGLYVGLTRFRDAVECIYSNDISPLAGLRAPPM